VKSMAMAKEWVLTLVFSVVSVLTLGLGLTWVNIERVDMAYELKRMQTDIETQEALIAKLNVERNTLLSPERLRCLAKEYGLSNARPGQIRRLSEAGEEMPSPVIKSAQAQAAPVKKAAAQVPAGPAKGKKKSAGKSPAKPPAAKAPAVAAGPVKGDT